MTTPAADASTDEVQIARAGRVGRIVLDRPKALNALTLGMVVAIRAALDAFAADPDVEAVMITGAGDRGLCAGGDVVTVRRLALTEGPGAASRFWTAEYAMNLAIAEHPKPVIAVMDGIVLGGGVGVSAHGSVRVVTERSRIGMPETGIGFFPDVGATYLLSRAPGELGTHLALTGTMVDGSDAIAAGLADVMVRSADLEAMGEACARDGSAAVGAFAVAAPASDLAAARDWVDAAYAADTVEAILDALTARPEPAARAAAETILTRSPTSLKVTLRALREARAMPGLREALAAEHRLAEHFTAGHDFAEGVRAQLVDKDRSPRWQPADLADVTDDVVDRYFRPV